MAIILNFNTATLEALVTSLVAAETADDAAEVVATAPYHRPADEPDAVGRIAARAASAAATKTKNTALTALTAYVTSII